MKPKAYDFSGWATKNDLKCTDGRTIRKDAFKHEDGFTVPLVWAHMHNDVENVLGKAILENREEGVYAYCSFNGNPKAQEARELVKHGDIASLSIWANALKQVGKDVLHGFIKEVSLVLAGANPGAIIDDILEHGDCEDEDGIITTGEGIELFHAADDKQADENGEGADKTKTTDEETAKDVFNSLSDKQKDLVYAMLGHVIEDTEDQNEGDDGKVNHNAFEDADNKKDEKKKAFLSHEDQVKIINSAKSSGVCTLKSAIELYAANNADLVHGIEGITNLFPEFKDVRPGAPEMLTTDQGWIGKVLAKVHKSPISRIRTRQADLRDIENLRAKGYIKGKYKTEVGNFPLLVRTTEPQTVFVKSKIDRDDFIDIQDFDVVQYLYAIDRMNLNEELARAILLGDGREVGEEGYIAPDKIRPVWLDDELYTIHKDVDITTMKAELQGTDTSAYFGENFIYAEAIIQTLLYAREKYRGSGSPDFFCTPHLLNVMLLSRDRNGHRIYANTNEIKTLLNVGEIITAEQFENKTRTTSDNKTKKLLGLMYNLADYSLGATKGGEITHFTDFDIDFNQQKSLLETRCSGANTRVLSAIALEEDVTEAG